MSMAIPIDRTSTDRDPSNGYEAVASEFMTRREQSGIGVATVRAWARSLRPGTSIPDLGCGHGVPISAALMDDGFVVYGVDSSPSLTAAFRSGFPQAHVACEAVEDSGLFDRKFGGIIAVGVDVPAACGHAGAAHSPRRSDIETRRTSSLHRAGRSLFVDGRTDRPAVLVVRDRDLWKSPSSAGLASVGEYLDEGGNHYYDSRRR